jgi:hypothetical protein
MQDEEAFVTLTDLSKNTLEDILDICFFYSPECSMHLSFASQALFEISNSKDFCRRIKRNPFFGSDPMCLSIFEEYVCSPFWGLPLSKSKKHKASLSSARGCPRRPNGRRLLHWKVGSEAIIRTHRLTRKMLINQSRSS